MQKMTETVLAIDYGTQHLGVAINRGSLAEPLTILVQDDQLLPKLQAICQAEGVARLVVGLSENEMARQTQHFAATVLSQLGLPIEFTDETLSSYQVLQKLKVTGKKAPRRRLIDDLAAAEFLQEWLDLQTP